MSGDIERRIRERAYEIWESEGRPESRSHDHWEQARAEFSEASAEAAQAPAASVVASAGEGDSEGQGTSAARQPATKASRAGIGRAGAAKPPAPSRRKKPPA